MLLFPGDPLLPWYLQDEILGFQLVHFQGVLYRDP